MFFFLFQKQRLARLEEIKKKEKALSAARKEEERKRWWDGVDVIHPLPTVNAARHDTSGSSVTVAESDEDELARSRRELQYSADYSRWNQWIPSDPVTVIEVRAIYCY